jgi:predicted RNA polymerase sigma factor
MPAQGTLNADGLSVARITVDMLQQQPKVDALAALINTKTGKTLAWANAEGGMWSNNTLAKLTELRESMEDDMAKALFSEHTSRQRSVGGRGVRVDGAGLGEHLGEGAVEAPSV